MTTMMKHALRSTWAWLAEPTLMRRSVASVLVAFVVVWAVLLGTAAVIAQENDADQQEETSNVSETESAPASGASDTNDSERGSGSPFDYEASEQISEDLSVSFPVDI